MTYLIFQVTLQDHMIKGSCGFMEGSSSLCVTTQPSLKEIVIVVEKI